MMVYLVAACLVIVLGSGGHALPNPFASTDECTLYYRVSRGAASCQETEFDYASTELSAKDVLDLVNFTCRNLPAWRQCVQKRFVSCETKEQILTYWDESYMFCQRSAPASWIANYAAMSTGTVSKACVDAVARTIGHCVSTDMYDYQFPDSDTSLQEGVDLFRGAIAAGFNCAVPNVSVIVSHASQCKGSTWKDVLFTFAVVMTSLPGDALAAKLTQEQLDVLQGILNN